MDPSIDKNKQDEDGENFEELEFKYNFLTTPWDDRSRKSKIGIVSLLVTIFFVTMVLVVNNFIMHYKNFGSGRNSSLDISCYRVKMEEYQFVASIHSVSTKDLLCVGAVVSETSVLVSGICTKSGAVKIHLGSHKESRCKKAFPIKYIEPLYHDKTISKRFNLVLMFSYESMAYCSKSIPIGSVLNWNAKLSIIGRSHRVARSLSRQYISLAKRQYQNLGSSIKNLNTENMLCIKDYVKCPVQAGDLLVQKGQLFGIAVTSVQRSDRSQLACFANLNIIKRELKELDENIDIRDIINETRLLV